MIIQEGWLKIKQFVDDALHEWGIMAVIAVSCLGSFALGRVSALVEHRPLITIKQAQMEVRPFAVGGAYVASRTGSAYYFPWCSGAAQIAEANKRWFATEKAARAAGYRPAKNCKGLVEGVTRGN